MSFPLWERMPSQPATNPRLTCQVIGSQARPKPKQNGYGVPVLIMANKKNAQEAPGRTQRDKPISRSPQAQPIKWRLGFSLPVTF